MNLKVLNIVLMFTIAILIASQGCSSTDESSGNSLSSDDKVAEAVKVMELNYSKISRGITYPANLMAFMEVHLAPASPGRIDKIHVDAGSGVSRGQLLVEMDRTQLQQAQVQLANVEKDFRRLDTLRRAGSISQQQFDQIRTQYEVALSNVEFLKENTRLTAPFSGVVSGKYFEDGEMFSGAPNTPAGKAAILSVVQTTRLKALINISENYYPDINTGMPVKISLDVWPGELFGGTVSRIYPTISPATRTFSIEVAVPNRDDKLRPGMFARATLGLDEAEVFVVPAIAVLKLQGSNERYVFLEDNGMARRVRVELGERFDDMVEIISDEIETGDNLITAGQARLTNGVAVVVN